MKTYFKTKIGETLEKRVVTGKKFYTEVFARKYKVEILQVKSSGEMTVEVNSYDLAPSGIIEGGTNKYFGEVKITLTDFDSKRDIMIAILRRADPTFDKKYNIAKIYNNNEE